MDCSVQGYIRTPPDLCPPFGFRAFLLGEPPVRRPDGHQFAAQGYFAPLVQLQVIIVLGHWV
jgi:hypothetical protein